MKARLHMLLAVAAAMLIAMPAGAQWDGVEGPAAISGNGAPIATEAVADPDEEAESEAGAINTQPAIGMQYFRAQDQRGMNVFEAPKDAGAAYTGFRLDWGAAFTQQFQGLDHSNSAAARVVDGRDLNELMNIGWGFNTATANLFLNAQLAPGIRVSLETYLSSRRHPEAWVKGGYLQIDESPLGIGALETLMEYTTVRAGHFGINYGDAQFRRTDNGNALFNPFVGNYIMDAFTTEVGAEVLVRHGPLLALGSVTGGEIKGSVTSPDGRAPSFIGKLGFDQQVNPDLRVRLTGSAYTTSKSVNNTLYGGDRAGSRYYFVLENVAATEASQATSGHINPGFRSEITAFQLNPFVKLGGMELFGVAERTQGRAANETDKRAWNQYAVDAVYRFLPNEQVFVGARWNEVNGELAGSGADVSVDRWQLGGGWFITPSVLVKGEYVSQRYNDFPTLDIRNGGKFNGFMIEGVVAF
jgi:hypothetical protein